ncbi:MAG: UvrD-helicase domain-containing protein [Rhodothermales bacterium]|nr:UvrD-helicase domain-containing protein [Rhodothermales bacterium]MBO6778274.1 UvrD-helicase domain-containing protein [Rhodothermales bacterium]
MKQYSLLPDLDKPSELATSDILDGLNEAQQEAASTTEGPLLIIAGPGSGKTRTLTHRIAYLLASGKARPHQILAITFTNKAAREMRHRVFELIGDEAKGMTIGTFHATFARVLRKEGKHIGYTSDFSIYDSDDTQRALRELLNQHNIDPKQFSPRAMYGLISSAKNRLVKPSEYARLAIGPAQEKAAKIYGPYQDLLRRSNAMDFDDLLLKPIELYRNHPEILEKYRGFWRYIHIDEYQDTNHAQYTLAKLLADGHQNLCVVGDDAQSIYAFRGADIGNILSFQRDYPEAKTVRLEQNYRSTKSIVALADAIIKGNTRQLEKKLWTDNDEGSPIIVMEALSERDEAQKIERRIRDLCLRHGIRYKDVAVLYRTNAQSRSIEEALRREDVPYRIVGGVSFYQRKEIKDAISYMRLVVNPHDNGSLKRVINYPTRGIGNKSQDLLFSWAEGAGLTGWEALGRLDEVPGLSSRARNAMGSFRDMIQGFIDKGESEPAGDLVRTIVNEAGLSHELMREHTPENLVRRENLEELISAVKEFTDNPETPDTVSAFLQEVSLLTDADSGTDFDDKVTLMTMHASKGLEYKTVFVTGLEEGLFPLSGAAQDPEELEEERRLFYVGATRAERYLYLSYARSRYRYGEHQSGVRSRFLDELGEGLLQTEAGGTFSPKQDRFKAKGGKGSYTEMDPFYYRRPLGGQKGPSEKGRTHDTRGMRGGTRRSAQSASPAPAGRRIVYDAEHSGDLAAGMQVEHGTFGEGRIVAIEGNGPQAKAVVFFNEVGEKKLMLRFANLQRIG